VLPSRQSWHGFVRHWRTQAGEAELRREIDRIHGAGVALDATLRAWGVTVGAAATKGAVLPTPLLRRKLAEVWVRACCSVHTFSDVFWLESLWLLFLFTIWHGSSRVFKVLIKLSSSTGSHSRSWAAQTLENTSFAWREGKNRPEAPLARVETSHPAAVFCTPCLHGPDSKAPRPWIFPCPDRLQTLSLSLGRW